MTSSVDGADRDDMAEPATLGKGNLGSPENVNLLPGWLSVYA